jgi:hypothetical protein
MLVQRIRSAGSNLHCREKNSAHSNAFWVLYTPAMSVEKPLDSKVLPRGVQLVWLVFCIVAGLLWLTCVVAHKLGYDSQVKILFDSPLTDITVYIHRFVFYRTPAFFSPSPDPSVSTFAYPPPAALIYDLFYKIVPHPRYIYVALAILWGLVVSTAAWRFWGRLLRSSSKGALFAATSLLFCFPFLFLVQRGNIELIVWAVISVGILAYFRGSYYLSAVLLGSAASIKLYPILLLGLFLSRRREFGPFLAGLASCAGLTLFALWFAGPSIGYAAHGFAAGVTGFQGGYGTQIRPVEIGFDHSLFSPIKLFAIEHHVPSSTLLRPYYLIAGLLAVVVFFLKVRRQPFVNKLVFLVAGMVLLPPVSFEYTLVYLYLPLAFVLMVLVRSPDATGSRAGLMALACLLAALLPVDLLGNTHTFFVGQLQVIPLLLLMCLAAMPWSFSGADVGALRQA